jgi:malate dehydrogenase (oxaloacetate-decarboxylating)
MLEYPHLKKITEHNMLEYTVKTDSNNKKYLETNITGKALLNVPQFNKGTAFTQEERESFGLLGKLPMRVETIQEQADRCYQQYKAFDEVLNRNIYLNQLLNTNQVLFYYLVSQHLQEMLPTIYTPIVGNAVKSFHKKFQQPRGLYIAYPDRDKIEQIIDNRSNVDIRLIVVSDGEGVLGIGDQGAGAMAIPVAKLMVYSAFAGIDPLTTLPIMLDAGTNNEALLNDPMYLGWHHPRVSGEEYNAFIDTFVDVIKNKFPHMFLHWEDFGRTNAFRHLIKYRTELPSFNDDIQGTGVVALAALNSALKIKKQTLREQRIVVFGAGSAGMGVTHRIMQALCHELDDEAAAHAHFWLVDRHGLISEYSPEVTDAQKPYQRSKAELVHWDINDKSHIELIDVVKHVKPTVLIGSSAVAGAFSDPVVHEMLKHEKQPIIFPLSNPNERCEATPKDLFEWTDGAALIATGSPFEPVAFKGKTYPISQCNNYLSFPGLGLGIIAVQATRLTDTMLMVASQALASMPLESEYELLPRVDHISAASKKIAAAVAKQAIEEGFATKMPEDGQSLEALIDATCWSPEYLPYKPLPSERG